MLKIHKGDNVVMMSGKDRGKSGKVLVVSAANNTIIVEGLNMLKRHVRSRKQGQKGQIISRERYISLSSAAVVCKSCGKPTRIGFQVNGDNKVRICKKCSATIS